LDFKGSSGRAAEGASKMRITVAPNREAVSTLFGEPAMFWLCQNSLAPTHAIAFGGGFF
jgi:hypothetical protein